MGRKKRYCSQSCRQRGYEQRVRLREAGVRNEATILDTRQLDRLDDALFELRCAAEDLNIALAEGANPRELQALSDELVRASRKAEQYRG